MRKLFWVWGIILATTVCAHGADLRVFCGAGLIKPMEQLRENFQTAGQVTVDIHYGSSGEIFGMLAAGQPCDVLIPGAAKYTMDAVKNGWVDPDTIRELVLHKPVIAVPPGNPAKIKGLDDLARKGVRLAIGDPKAPAIGRVAKKILSQADLWQTVEPNIRVYAPTVNQLLIYITLKQADAAIIWEDLSSWSEARGKIQVVPIAPSKNIIKTIPTAVCTAAKNKKLARAFNQYVASEAGLAIWRQWGFSACAP